MRILAQDVRYGLRTLRKAPAFTLVVISILGLGIGATTSIFAVVDALLLNPLPYPDAERLVILWQGQPEAGVDKDWLSPPQFLDIREHNTVFDEMALTFGSSTTLTGQGDPVEIGHLYATSSYLPMLGAVPLFGRLLDSRDEQDDAEQVAVLTHGLWQRRFRGDPGVVGAPIQLNGKPFRVVGVLPPEVVLDGEVMPTSDSNGRIDVVLPMQMSDERWQHRALENFNIVARLRPEVEVSDAQADLEDIAIRMIKDHPESYQESLRLTVVPLLEEVVGSVRRPLAILLGAVSVLLLIACGNVANLMLARGAVRQHELGVRMAVGAGHVRLLRQLLTESFLLASLGGLLGLVAAFAGAGLLRSVGSAVDLPRSAEIAVDGNVFVFTLAVTVVTCLVFGLVPARRATCIDLGECLRPAQRGSVDGALWNRFNTASALVAGEVALSLVLLIGGGLLVRSFLALQDVDPGFNADGVLTFQTNLTASRYRSEEACRTFFDDVLSDIRALSGVEKVGAATILPFGPSVSWGPIEVEGYVPKVLDERPVADYRVATPDYVETLEIPLLRGRTFKKSDDAEASQVALVDERFAARFWPDGRAVGQRVGGWSEGWATIVGVVGTVRQSSLAREPRMTVYFPHAQVPVRRLYVAARGSAELSSLIGPVTRVVHRHDGEIAVTDVATQKERLADSMARRRFVMLVLQAFAVVALLLAVVGIYGVVSYRVHRGMHDLGLRMALGATPDDVLGLVLRHGMAMALLGVVAGLPMAFWLSGLLESLLFGVEPTDASTYAALVIVLVGVTLLACMGPARRAARIDPLDSLRE